jgi:hypothetical protein
MVASRIGGPDERKAARDALQARMAPPPQTAGKAKPVPVPRWLEAWCRIGIGRSLLRESDESSRMQGVIQLLHLPARFGTQEPYLCEVALAEASVALNELGDAAGASALKYELKERLPRSAALQWEPLKKVKDQGPGNKTRPESGASMTAAPRTMTRQYKDRS